MSGDQSRKGDLRRRTLEALAWVAIVGFLWTIDLMAKFSFREQTGYGKDDFRLITEQATSAVAVLIMIPFVLRWLRMFPLKKEAWVAAIIGHTAGTAIFAFGHQCLMFAFRGVIYGIKGIRFNWIPDFVPNLIVEHQKDIKIYLGIVFIATAYRWYGQSRSPAGARSPPGPQRKLLVQTGGGESVVRYGDIDYLEASRNYVVVHSGEREFLVRDTIGNVEKLLSEEQFARVHRSFIVNTDKIAEIRAIDNGYQIRLNGGATVPLSRSYRESVKEKMAT